MEYVIHRFSWMKKQKEKKRKEKHNNIEILEVFLPPTDYVISWGQQGPITINIVEKLSNSFPESLWQPKFSPNSLQCMIFSCNF